jgi:hypothetical protein
VPKVEINMPALALDTVLRDVSGLSFKFTLRIFVRQDN